MSKKRSKTIVSDAIRAELKRVGRSKYWLAQHMVELGVCKTKEAAYKQLRKGRKPLMYERMLEVLGLEVVPRKSVGK